MCDKFDSCNCQTQWLWEMSLSALRDDDMITNVHTIINTTDLVGESRLGDHLWISRGHWVLAISGTVVCVPVWTMEGAVVV